MRSKSSGSTVPLVPSCTTTSRPAGPCRGTPGGRRRPPRTAGSRPRPRAPLVRAPIVSWSAVGRAEHHRVADGSDVGRTGVGRAAVVVVVGSSTWCRWCHRLPSSAAPWWWTCRRRREYRRPWWWSAGARRRAPSAGPPAGVSARPRGSRRRSPGSRRRGRRRATANTVASWRRRSPFARRNSPHRRPSAPWRIGSSTYLYDSAATRNVSARRRHEQRDAGERDVGVRARDHVDRPVPQVDPVRANARSRRTTGSAKTFGDNREAGCTVAAISNAANEREHEEPAAVQSSCRTRRR